MDVVDEKIIELLRKNSRTPYTKMSEILELSEGAVRRRIQKLIQSGKIQRFTIEGRDERLKAIVLVSVAPPTPTSQIAEKILTVKGITSLFEVTGPYDITLNVCRDDIASINQSIEEIRQIKGVQKTNTLFVLREW